LYIVSHNSSNNYGTLQFDGLCLPILTVKPVTKLLKTAASYSLSQKNPPPPEVI